MGLFSYETIEKILFPENKKQKIVGNICLFLIVNSIICYFLKKLTWGYFLEYHMLFSILILFWLNVLYDYNDNKRKLRLKRLKEIYESYYWFVTHFDPYKLSFESVDSPYPDCFKLAVKESCQFLRLFDDTKYVKTFMDKVCKLSWWEVPPDVGVLRKELEPECKANLSLTPIREFSGFYKVVSEEIIEARKTDINSLFLWHFKKGIPVLCTRDNKPITDLMDIERLWQDLNIPKPIKSEWDILMGIEDLSSMDNVRNRKIRIDSYFADQHLENLKKLGDC